MWWTSKLPAVFAAFGTTSSSLNSDQTKQGWLYCGPWGQWLAYTFVMPGQRHQFSQPQDTVTPILGDFFS